MRRSCHVSRVVNERMKRATLSRMGAPRHRSSPLVLTARLPPKVNSLDKCAVCTTGAVFNVDAVVNDRATSICGVSDVLSTSLFGMEASSVTPSCLVSPTATRTEVHHRVSLAVGFNVPAPWMGRDALHRLTFTVS